MVEGQGRRAGAPVEAVIFDWGGTLTPWHTVDLTEQWRAFAATIHDDEREAEAFAARVMEVEAAAWARGRRTHQSARMEEILAEAGHDLGHPHHTAAQAAYEEFWEPHTLTDPQVQPLWEGLRDRGIRVGVLSNTIWTREYHRGVLERDGVLHLVDGDVYSSEIDHVKPHPAAFLAAAAAVEVEPTRAVYVGDRLFEDVHGPKQVGMRAIWVPHSDIPEVQRVQVDTAPDAEVHELLEVLDVVDRWLGDASS
jgi:putative hydrolase of the HAD superfamily